MSIEHQSDFDKDNSKSYDWLPDGRDTVAYLKEDEEWPKLERRLGKPRILDNFYFPEVMAWIKKNFSNYDNFSYFEAGCGNGNDLRAIRKELGGRGHFLGVDMSRAEIKSGLKYYQEQENEDIDEARELFAQGNLRDLKDIKFYNGETNDYDRIGAINDGEFSVIYINAVLQGLGYGEKTYREKKAAAQEMLNELARICQPDGKFFGKISVFAPDIAKEQQFELFRQTSNWRFMPDAEEFKKMLQNAGFSHIKMNIASHEATADHHHLHRDRLSFLAEK